MKVEMSKLVMVSVLEMTITTIKLMMTIAFSVSPSSIDLLFKTNSVLLVCLCA